LGHDENENRFHLPRSDDRVSLLTSVAPIDNFLLITVHLRQFATSLLQQDPQRAGSSLDESLSMIEQQVNLFQL
jgi:hypothetical protein